MHDVNDNRCTMSLLVEFVTEYPISSSRKISITFSTCTQQEMKHNAVLIKTLFNTSKNSYSERYKPLHTKT